LNLTIVKRIDPGRKTQDVVWSGKTRGTRRSVSARLKTLNCSAKL